MIKESDQLKIDVIAKVSAGLLTRKTAAKILRKNRSTITRYVKEYRKVGPLFVVHKATGKPSHHKTPDKLKEEIMTLISKEYYDYNVRHAYEKLAEHDLQKISYRTLLRWYHEKKFIKKLRKRRRKAHKARERMPNRGLLLQLDGSFHKWFGSEKSCLIAAIDDADNDVPYAEFFKGETTINCMKLLKNIIELKGIPRMIYVDRAGVFGGTKRIEFCQFEEACKKLDINIIYAYSAEAKGRIERLWRTLQGRIIPEMRTRGIGNMTEANEYLQNIFLPTIYRKKFTVPPHREENDFRPCTHDLNEILTIRYTRVVKNDNTFSYDSVIYQINSSMDCSKGVVEIRKYLNGDTKFFFKENKLDVSIFKSYKIAA